MKDEQLIDALFEKTQAWRHADQDKQVDVYPTPLVAMLDAVFRERSDLRQDLKRWKAVALYLAECHAANAECPPKSLSKYNRSRYKGILEKAVGFLKGAWPTHHVLAADPNKTIERCEQAMEELGV